MKRIVLILAGIMLVVWGGSVLAAEPVAAVVKTLTPEAWVERDGLRSPANTGDMVFPGDTLVTGGSGTLGIIFKDGAVLSLGPDSEYVLEQYLFQPQEEEYSMESRFLSGTATFMSGAMGRIAPEAVILRTPESIIGLRGTKILIEVR